MYEIVHGRVYGTCMRCRERHLEDGGRKRDKEKERKKGPLALSRGKPYKWTRTRRRVNRACSSCSNKWMVNVNVAARGVSPLIETQKSRAYPTLDCN